VGGQAREGVLEAVEHGRAQEHGTLGFGAAEAVVGGIDLQALAHPPAVEPREHPVAHEPRPLAAPAAARAA
jgi:hypothetical protein